jgi:hypothetical protein
MDKIRVIHDPVGQTLTVWWGDPASESICEETADEVVLMKDAQGRVIGCEMLHYQPADTSAALAVEAIVQHAA